MYGSSDMCYKYADYVIRKYNEQNVSLSNKALQKILFLANVIYARKTGTKMFDDDFYAWEYGPVMPSIYANYSRYQTGNMLPISLREENIDFEKSMALNEAMNYAEKIGIQKLIDNTHKVGTPWQNSFSQDALNKIEFSDILKFYSVQENFDGLIEA